LPTAIATAPERASAARARYLATFAPSVVLDKLIGVYRELADAH